MSTTDEIRYLLGLSGYKAGPGWASPAVVEIERQVCEQSACPECGHIGLTFHCYHRMRPKLYRSVAVCPDCRWWHEL